MVRIMAGVIVVLLLASVLLFWRSQSLSEKNATLEQSNAALADSVKEWEKAYGEQKTRAEKLDKMIAARDETLKKNAREREHFLRTIEGLQNENEGIRSYLDGVIPDDLVRLLLPEGPGGAED